MSKHIKGTLPPKGTFIKTPFNPLNFSEMPTFHAKPIKWVKHQPNQHIKNVKDLTKLPPKLPPKKPLKPVQTSPIKEKKEALKQAVKASKNTTKKLKSTILSNVLKYGVPTLITLSLLALSTKLFKSNAKKTKR